ncbi:Cytochrome c-type biogenesis protein CcmE, heme chaperone [hydrothermal vent metagenome]|uniref:Cytochrome c-type biogenesis protein CcmE, heme chaperone n=1 Tax=hydrothermal vent metagenome TaxID=652676 RepID=A0A3B0S5J9_9ZZZZ
MKKPATKAGMRKKRRLYLMFTSIAVLGLAVLLVLSALEDSIRLFYDPTEIVEKGIKPGQDFRLGGLVADDSLERHEVEGAMINKFTVTDGNETVDVTYEGLLPDLFREGQGVVAEGSMNSAGVFVATEVLAKHDENYMPKEVIDSLKKRGEWQRDKSAMTNKAGAS